LFEIRILFGFECAKQRSQQRTGQASVTSQEQRSSHTAIAMQRTSQRVLEAVGLSTKTVNEELQNEFKRLHQFHGMRLLAIFIP
jgi:hypothetical protein